jgi:F0F1-type ATP synthase assembly protein I
MAKLPKPTPQTWTRHMGIGVEYAGAVAGFTLLGWWVDTRWETAPAGVLIGLTLGLIGATYNLIRESLSAFKSLEEKPPETSDRRDDSKPSE